MTEHPPSPPTVLKPPSPSSQDVRIFYQQSPQLLMNVFRRFFSSIPSTSMANATAKAQQVINDNAVGKFCPAENPASSVIRLLTTPCASVVFSKSYCPYCAATKSLLSSLDVDPTVLELDLLGMLTFTL